MPDYLKQYKRNEKSKNNAGRGTPMPGEIWWVSNLDNIKDRPILVVGYSGNTVSFLRCTSQTSAEIKRALIEDYLEAGLEKPTYVDTLVRMIARSRLERKLGVLSDYDRAKFGL